MEITAWACRACGKLTQNWRVCQICKQPAEWIKFVSVEHGASSIWDKVKTEVDDEEEDIQF